MTKAQHKARLRRARAKVDRREAELAAAREERNVAIFEACTDGEMSEREAAEDAGVSNGYAGRCHRTEGHPERERG
jgi:hypothetical protein